jgi:hypothetical protein
MPQALNAFYGTGKVIWVPSPGEAGRSAQEGVDFVLGLRNVRNGRAMRLPCCLGRRLRHRAGSFRVGDFLYVFGSLSINEDGRAGLDVRFVRFIHPRGIDVRTVEEVGLDLAKSRGRFTRAEVARRLGLRGNQAGYWLSKLVRAGRLRRVGKGRGAWYELAA